MTQSRKPSGGEASTLKEMEALRFSVQWVSRLEKMQAAERIAGLLLL